MLTITANMNSEVADIFAFKTCCGMHAFDQNLEILVKNTGNRTMVVPSYMDLRTEQGAHRITTLMPSGDLRIPPGEIKAFYCTMDDVLWNAASELVLYDLEANAYAVEVSHDRPD